MEPAIRRLEVQIVDLQADDLAPGVSSRERAAVLGQQFEYRLSQPSRPTAKTADALTVRIYGRTPDGRSVLIFVDGMRPQLFMLASAARETECAWRERCARQGKLDATALQTTDVVGSWFYGWEPSNEVGKPRQHQFKRFAFRSRRDMFGFARMAAELGHETKVDIATQFVQERNLTVTGWVTVDAVDVPAGSRASHCDLEVRCEMGHVALLEARAAEIAPIRTLSYDIECTTSAGFPKAIRSTDCVTFIAAVLHVYGKPAEDAERVLFSAGPCDAIDGADVRVYDSEGEMLAGFRDYIIDCDADVITGYNIDGFDNRYTWTRASSRAPTFAYLSRLIWSPSRLEERTQKSQQTGAQDLALLRMEGRITVDMHTVMRAKKESTYKLGAMARKYLKADKIHLDDDADEEDMDNHYKVMNELCLSMDPAKRKSVGVYCIHDAYLALLLMLSQKTHPSQVSMSRITSTPWQRISVGGQQQRVYNQLYRASKMATPMRVLNSPSSGDTEDTDDEAGIKYTGAEVLEPIKGMYTKPVTTLDFGSLYPSIMGYMNLCPSTLVRDAARRKLLLSLVDGKFEEAKIIEIASVGGMALLNLLNEAPGSLSETPIDLGDMNGSSFRAFYVGGDVPWVFFCSSQPGLVPTVLTNLLSERKVKKRAMEQAFERATVYQEAGDVVAYDAEMAKVAILNGDQLALKVSANSIYGFMGAQECGILPCVEIAKVTTMVGRYMIGWTKTIVEDMFDGNVEVIYGDTDSVFCHFKDLDAEDLETAFARGDQMATEATRIIKISVLENEKTYKRFLLMRKKRYVGLMYEKVGDEIKQTKMDTKGIDVVRRDNFEFARRVSTEFLRRLMYDGDLEGAIAKMQEHLVEFRKFKLPISDFVQSKSLRDDYASENLIHLAVVRKMAARNPGSEPKTGDRVQYVLTRSQNANAKACEKADDPVYVERHTIQLDYVHYLRNTMSQLCGLLEPCTPKPERLFSETVAIVEKHGMEVRDVSSYEGVTVRTTDEARCPTVRKLGSLIATDVPRKRRATARPRK
jgi:DNA polymerase delta subunit 1